jgi:PAS domain S-box-containing protein
MRVGDARRSARPEGFWSFVVVSCLAQALLGWPFTDLPHPAAAGAATAVFAATLVAALLESRRSRPTLAHVAPAYLALVVVALWCYADGGSSSDFTVMYVLPVLWLALNGTVPQVWAAISAAALAMIVPILVFHDDYYQWSDLRAAVLVVAASCLIGPLARTVTRDRARRLARSATLGPARTHFEGILEASIEHAVLTTDDAGAVTALNPGAERLLGWTSEQVVGLHLDRLLSRRSDDARPDTSGSAYQSLTTPALRGRPEPQTWWTHPPTGEPVPLTVTASALREGTDLAGFVFMASAESDAREALAALASQREIYLNLVSHLPSTVVGVLDQDLVWVRVNGRDSDGGVGGLEDLQGHPFGESLTPEVGAHLREMATEAFVSGEQHLEIESRPGEWWEYDAVPIAAELGERRVLVVAREVSARHAVEAERHRLLQAAVAGEELFRTIFESSPIGKILISHPDGGPPRLLGANPAFGRLVGIPPDELADLPLSEVVAQEDHGKLLEMQTVLETRGLEVRFRRPSGRVIWCEVQCTRVTPRPGEESFVIGQVLDVTDRKDTERALLDALERQRAAAEALREADSVRTEVMSTVSHELRTPLTSITGYVELLVDGHAGPLVPQQREMMEVIDRNSRRLQELVDDLLLLSQLDQGTAHEDLAWEVVDLREIVHRSVETVRPLVSGRVQRLTITMADEPVLVRGDAGQLDRALTNLLSNACKYTFPGGQITVGLDAPDHQSARLWVADNGVGIPALELTRLFTRFFRASSGRATGASGSGLGLAIVKSLVELHGGRVSVTSEQGIGSTFVLTLPTVQGALPPVLQP